MNNKKFTFVDLFAGIGGFRISLEKQGGICVGFSEIDKPAIEVYKNNFNTTKEKELGDIKEITSLPKCDLVVGGVPCQAWSIAGKKKGFDDPRGKLWEDCVRLLNKRNKPKAFIFENVKGLYDPRNRSSLNFLLSKFRECGYEVYHKILNAYDFGLPQNRDRLFIVGIRKNIKTRFEFPYPIEQTVTLDTVMDNVKILKSHIKKKKFLPRDLFGERIPFSRNRFQKQDELNDFFIFCDTRDGHTTIHSWDIYKTSKRQKEICMAFLKNRRKKLYGEWDGNPLSLHVLKNLVPKSNLKKSELMKLVKMNILRVEDDGRFDLAHTKNSAGIDGIYRVFLPNSDVFATITATENRDFIATKSIKGNNKDEYKKNFLEKIINKGNYRLITGRESARLQGFPEKFKIHENDKIAKKQFGNAVPTNVVYYLCKNLPKFL